MALITIELIQQPKDYGLSRKHFITRNFCETMTKWTLKLFPFIQSEKSKVKSGENLANIWETEVWNFEL